MNLAIEYLLRSNRVEKLLKFPCSLFLENKKSKVAITLQKNSDGILVKNFTLGGFLLSYKECIIKEEDVFLSPEVILPEHQILEFELQPPPKTNNQVNDFPLASIQERQYKNYIINFFSSKKMNSVREDWLWKIFAKNLPKNLIDTYYNRHYQQKFIRASTESQREFIRAASKEIIQVWDGWRKELLFVTDPAVELVFSKYFAPKEKKSSTEDTLESKAQAILEMIQNL